MFHSLILLILIIISGIDPRFVMVGQYPDLVGRGINTHECGTTMKGVFHHVDFPNKCSKSNISNMISVVDVRQMNSRVDGDQPSKRIYDGQRAKYGEAPFAVIIKHKWGYFFDKSICTGTLISPDWVLTAGHCYKEYSANIIMGTNTWTSPYVRRVPHENWFVHPEYNRSDYNTQPYDIALIKLNALMPQITEANNFLVNPICLPSANQYNRNEEQATFFGWGIIASLKSDSGFRATIYTNFLAKADTTLVGSQYCYNHTRICNKYRVNTPNGCTGDSGGPLVQYTDESRTKAILIGVLSTGANLRSKSAELATFHNCDQTLVQTHWTSVSRNMAWILKTIRDN